MVYSYPGVQIGLRDVIGPVRQGNCGFDDALGFDRFACADAGRKGGEFEVVKKRVGKEFR
jgi:hypothetical protein